MARKRPSAPPPAPAFRATTAVGADLDLRWMVFGAKPEMLTPEAVGWALLLELLQKAAGDPRLGPYPEVQRFAFGLAQQAITHVPRNATHARELAIAALIHGSEPGRVVSRSTLETLLKPYWPGIASDLHNYKRVGLDRARAPGRGRWLLDKVVDWLREHPERTTAARLPSVWDLFSRGAG